MIYRTKQTDFLLQLEHRASLYLGIHTSLYLGIDSAASPRESNLAVFPG